MEAGDVQLERPLIGLPKAYDCDEIDPAVLRHDSPTYNDLQERFYCTVLWFQPHLSHLCVIHKLLFCVN